MTTCKPTRVWICTPGDTLPMTVYQVGHISSIRHAWCGACSIPWPWSLSVLVSVLELHFANDGAIKTASVEGLCSNYSHSSAANVSHSSQSHGCHTCKQLHPLSKGDLLSTCHLHYCRVISSYWATGEAVCMICFLGRVSLFNTIISSKVHAAQRKRRVLRSFF